MACIFATTSYIMFFCGHHIRNYFSRGAEDISKNLEAALTFSDAKARFTAFAFARESDEFEKYALWSYEASPQSDFQ